MAFVPHFGVALIGHTDFHCLITDGLSVDVSARLAAWVRQGLERQARCHGVLAPHARQRAAPIAMPERSCRRQVPATRSGWRSR